jgi:hypothetical protein
MGGREGGKEEGRERERERERNPTKAAIVGDHQSALYPFYLSIVTIVNCD